MCSLEQKYLSLSHNGEILEKIIKMTNLFRFDLFPDALQAFVLSAAQSHLTTQKLHSVLSEKKRSSHI